MKVANPLSHVVRFLCCLLIIASGMKITDGQFKTHQVFSPIPSHLQKRLVQRLKLYAKYERTKNYEKLYELLSEPALNDLGLHDKAAYIKYKQRTVAHPSNGILLNFIPRATDYNESTASYRISGQGQLRYKGGVLKQEVIIYAWLVDCDWYFSQVLIELVD